MKAAKTVGRLALGCTLALCLTSEAQTNLNFNGVSVSEEGMIRLSWNSQPNEYYEIDYADSLVDTNTGLTPWKLLYDDYPSQGTNTFWLDTGNYFIDPAAERPSKTAMRFYRIVLSGTNTGPAPMVAIASPTNGFSTSGTLDVTVSAASDQPLLFTKLYVDGQEMQDADDTTNYVDNGTNYVLATYILNTCEWPNGSHTLFATAESFSGASGIHDIPAVLIGRAVADFVPVVYDNLITRISFSEPFFMPEDGQTQQVSAVFAANSDWTLQIQDSGNNTVRTATGSGNYLVFGWDGKDDNGADLPVGNYTYLISAETNRQPNQLSSGDSSGGTTSVSPPSPSFATASADSNVQQLWALPKSDSGDIVPFAIYPPGFDTNDLFIFSASQSDIDALHQTPTPIDSSTATAIPMVAGSSADAATPSSESSRAPVRPPTAPTRGRAGWFGVAYDTYRGVASGYTVPNPDNGLHIGLHIGMEGYSGSQSFTYPVLWQYISEARNFIKQMKKGNWSLSFDRFDDQLSISDLRSTGANIFNNVKLGLLMLHGTYGTDPDYTANACEQMYFPVTSGASAQYLRMSEMSLGSSDPNGLKWMAIAACNSLYEPNWSSMLNAGVHPNNSNLHLLLGTDSFVWTEPNLMAYWAKYVTVGKIKGSPMTIRAAWYAAAQDAYSETHFNYTNSMSFAVAGDAACVADSLQTNSVPTGTPFYDSAQVWP